MNAWRLALSALFLGAALAHAGDDFPLRYGAYTGGHLYSHNVAYGYGFPFSPADTWRRDLLAYPGGIYPYRPYGQPIYYRVYPIPVNPPVNVIGPDGLPILSNVAGAPGLLPVPLDPRCCTVRIVAPAGAKVWVEKQAVASGVWLSPQLAAGEEKEVSLRAEWKDKSGTREQFRTVSVKAGQTARVDFTKAE